MSPMIEDSTNGATQAPTSTNGATLASTYNVANIKTMPFLHRFSKLQIPATGLTALTHPLTDEVVNQTNEFFLKHWPFPSEKAKTKFVEGSFCRLTCYYFPKALNDRLHFACEIMAVLFLVDDILEFMSLEEGRAYNEKLMPISRGEVLPDRNVPVEWITYDIWEAMRKCDKELADDILEPCFDFMRSQTDPRRLTKMNMSQYLDYRWDDVGKDFLSAVIRFTQGLHLSKEELALTYPVDRNCGNHLSVLNDIYSYNKEAIAANTLHKEGGIMCNAVDIFANEAAIPIESAKRVLYQLCREYELVHETLVADVLKQRDTPDMRKYLKETEYQISGNEMWSRTTPRYSNLSFATVEM